jgi:hypothetical protein
LPIWSLWSWFRSKPLEVRFAIAVGRSPLMRPGGGLKVGRPDEVRCGVVWCGRGDRSPSAERMGSGDSTHSDCRTQAAATHIFMD